MNITLGREDGRAVDLLLDRGARASDHGNGQSIYASVDPSLGQRVAKAQQLLELLDWFPAPDPPQELAASTIKIIEGLSRNRAAVTAPLHHLAGGQRPHA